MPPPGLCAARSSACLLWKAARAGPPAAPLQRRRDAAQRLGGQTHGQAAHQSSREGLKSTVSCGCNPQFVISEFRCIAGPARQACHLGWST